MKNILLLLVVLLTLFSCSNDDDNDNVEIINLRVNHYKSAELIPFFGFPGTSLLVQEGAQIGQDDFTPLSIGIIGFEHELGFVYDLKVAKINIENPPEDSSNIELRLINIVSKTEINPDTEFKVRLAINRIDGEFVNWLLTDNNDNISIANDIGIDCGSLCNELSEKITNKEQITGVFTHGEGDVYILKEILNE